MSGAGSGSVSGVRGYNVVMYTGSLRRCLLCDFPPRDGAEPAVGGDSDHTLLASVSIWDEWRSVFPAVASNQTR